MSDRSHSSRHRDADSSLKMAQHLSASFLNLGRARSLPQLLESAVNELQSLLDCDRVIVYQLTEPNWGTIIAEAVRPPASVSLHHQIQDTCFQASPHPASARTVNDISQESFSPCYLNLLDHFQVKSYLINPLQPEGQPPWGWLMAHQCHRPRTWTSQDGDVSRKLAEYLTLRLEQLGEHQQLTTENQALRTRLEHQTQLLKQQGQFIQSLEKTVRWQQQILSYIDEAAVVVDQMGCILYWSPQAEALYNMGAEQVIGHPLETYCQVLGPSPLHDHRLNSFPQDNWRGTLMTRRQDGQKLLVDVWAQRLGPRSPQGRSPRSAAWLATLRPVSDQRLLEVALEPREDEFSLIVESAPVGLLLADPLGACRYVNPSWCQTTGLSREDSLDFGWLTAIHPGDRDRVFQAWDQAVAERQQLSLQYRILRPDQSLCWISSTIIALYDSQDSLMGYVGTLRDITSEKLAEDALRESESKFRQLAENIRQIFFILSCDGEMLYISPIYKEVFQRPYQELYQNPRRWLECVHHGDRRQVTEALNRQIHQGQVFEETYRIVRPSGEVRWLSTKAFPVPDHQGASYRFVGLAEDISDRKLAEDALKRQYRNVLLLKNLTEEIRQSLDSQQIVQIAAHQIGRTFGVSRCLIFSYEAQPQPQLKAVAEFRHPTLPSLLGEIIPIQEHPYSLVVMQQDIAQVWDDVSENPLLKDHQPFFETNEIRSMLGIRTSYQGEANGEICLHQCSLRRWSSDEVNLIEAVAAQVGIALAQAAILKREMEHRQQLSAKNQALGLAKQEAEAANLAKSQFLAMMSHEIRTPLNAVIGNAELLLHSPLNPQQQSFSHTIRQSSETLLALINDILDFSKIESGHLDLELRPFALDTCLLEALDLVAVTAEQKQLNLLYSLQTPIPQIWLGDIVRLKQIVLNLLANAVKFTEQGQIKLSLEQIDTATVDDPRQTLHFKIQDTGIGIAGDRVGHLFKPFSQSDNSITRRYGGTGLGLTISQRLCQLMEGQIWVESELGQGSTFHVTVKLLPKTDSANLDPITTLISPNSRWPQSPSLDESPFDETLAQRLPLHLLVAEDLRVNQALIQQLLRRFGYEATLVNNGLEAVQQVQQENFDVLLMDIQMPELDGWSATRQIRQQLSQQGRPQPYIIALTAHALEGDRQLCLDAGMDDYLTKPLRAARLRQALEGSTSGRLQSWTRAPQSPIPSGVPGAIPVLDFQVIDELKQMAGDLDFVAEMIQSYLDDVPQRLQSLRLALEAGELDMINEVAHALGSLSASLGAATLTHRCRTLERQIRQGRFIDVTDSERQTLIQDFERDFDHVYTALTRLLQRLDYD